MGKCPERASLFPLATVGTSPYHLLNAAFRGAKLAHSFRGETPHFPGKSGAFSQILVGDFWQSRRLAATLILASYRFTGSA